MQNIVQKMSQAKLKLLNEFPSNFRFAVLPTNSDVIKAIYFKANNQPTQYKSAIEKISKIVAVIWDRAEVPCITVKSIERKISTLFEKYKCMIKTHPSRQVNEFMIILDEKTLAIESNEMTVF